MRFDERIDGLKEVVVEVVVIAAKVAQIGLLAPHSRWCHRLGELAGERAFIRVGLLDTGIACERILRRVYRRRPQN
jgi:hypothetical protein|tara:strand:- start:332 stop:559 length:228 start_codon:yes stop_codon:yes gene_type:complete